MKSTKAYRQTEESNRTSEESLRKSKDPLRKPINSYRESEEPYRKSTESLDSYRKFKELPKVVTGIPAFLSSRLSTP